MKPTQSHPKAGEPPTQAHTPMSPEYMAATANPSPKFSKETIEELGCVCGEINSRNCPVHQINAPKPETWHIAGRRDGLIQISDSHGHPVANAFRMPNARLIASAPETKAQRDELAAELEWITRCAKKTDAVGITWYAIADEHMDTARALVAKL